MKLFSKKWIIDHYNKPVLIIYSVIASFLIQILFIFLFEAVGIQHGSNLKIVPAHTLTEYMVLIKDLLLSVILSPLFETLIFQTFLYYIFVDKLKFS